MRPAQEDEDEDEQNEEEDEDEEDEDEQDEDEAEAGKAGENERPGNGMEKVAKSNGANANANEANWSKGARHSSWPGSKQHAPPDSSQLHEVSGDTRTLANGKGEQTNSELSLGQNDEGKSLSLSLVKRDNQISSASQRLAYESAIDQARQKPHIRDLINIIKQKNSEPAVQHQHGTQASLTKSSRSRSRAQVVSFSSSLSSSSKANSRSGHTNKRPLRNRLSSTQQTRTRTRDKGDNSTTITRMLSGHIKLKLHEDTLTVISTNVTPGIAHSGSSFDHFQCVATNPIGQTSSGEGVQLSRQNCK